MNPTTINYPKILLHCQYVYGIGHLVRAVELARGLSKRFQGFILNGGETVPNFELPETVKFIQLPSIYKEEELENLLPVDTSITLNECFLRRESIINSTVDEIKPDILITEHFPFGLLFEKEVVGLINKVKHVNPSAKIVGSVRDIIESSKGGKRDDHVCNLINKWYNIVLVHGDDKFVSLSKSFPKANDINIPVVHTGYIVRTIPTKVSIENIPTILTSVAGGRLGTELLDAMIESHEIINSEQKHKMVLFSGAFQKDFLKLQDKVASLKSENIEVYRFDSRKYQEHLSYASLIISLGGYNSLIESVSARKPLIVYNRKFVGDNEEQDLRIKVFQESEFLKVITPDDLESEKLSNIILEKLKKIDVPLEEININGVQNSCRQLLSLLKLEMN